jgi:hypothetical protein
MYILLSDSNFSKVFNHSNEKELYAPRMGIPASETLTFCRKLLTRALMGKFHREHYTEMGDTGLEPVTSRV